MTSVSGLSSTSQKPWVWILEDDEGICVVYQWIFGERYALRFFKRLQELRLALEAGDRGDVLIADLSLPDGNFLEEVLSPSAPLSLRRMPFLVVSSMDDAEFLRACFAAGALDFLIKPFAKNEIMVKLERILSTVAAPSSAVILPEITFDPVNIRVTIQGQTLEDLTPKELQILACLNRFVREDEKPVSRREIEQTIWGPQAANSKRLDVHLFNLRRKLRRTGLDIQFIQGEGYRLKIPDSP